MSDLELVRTILVEFPYGLLGSLVAAVLCGYLSVFIVSKRIVFVGATLTQVAVAGIALSHLLLPHSGAEVGAMVVTLTVVVALARLLRSGHVARDTVLGISFVIAIALRILIIQVSPATEVAEIDAILKGDMLFVTPDQFIMLAVTAALLLAVHLAFQKEFMYVSFDPDTATTQGIRAERWEILFYVTIAIAISVATRIVGDVFVFGFLVLPAATAALLARRMSTIFLVSVIAGAIPPSLGLYAAFRLDLPAGPTTVAVSFILFIVTWIFRRQRA
ncbi:MAG: metal ABC transporter permease [Bacteroidota bacterium]